MSFNDYIHMDIEKVQKLKENRIYLEKFKLCMDKNLIWKIINRPIYHYTMMREDIYFIECELENKQSFLFTVNEKSFWKRFEFIKNKENNEIFNKYEYTTNEFLFKLLNNEIECEDIKLKILWFEQNKLKEYYNSYPVLEAKKNEPSIKLVNNMSIKILNFTNYSKRLWLELLNEFDFTSDENVNNNEELSYKFSQVSNSQGTNNKYINYEQFLY